MDFLYYLESIRMPVMDKLALLVTEFGDVMALLVIGLVVFWCVDKRKGYYLLGVGLLGGLISQFMKIACRVPRPWVLDKNFTPVAGAIENAGGYSFPSGHTQSAVGVFGCLATFSANKLWKVLCLLLALAVAFSRMYLGVHTPADVTIGAVIGILLCIFLYPMSKPEKEGWIPGAVITLVALSVGYFLYLYLFPFPENLDLQEHTGALENAYTILGSSAAFLVGYFVDKKWLKFSTQAVWWAQIIKVVVGLLLVIGVLELTKAPLNQLFAGHMAARGVRYFLTAITAAVLWPMSFRWFFALGKKGE